MSRQYDLITMGRSSIDLYSNDIGAPFPEITSFGAFVGGCPTNIVVGAARLGLRTGLLTAVGTDPVGDFVLRFLDNEGVDVTFIPRKADKRTSAVVLGIEPPDRFPLVFYRDGCADIALTIDDVNAAPLTDTKCLLISGTGLSRDPSRSATLYAVERAREAGAEILLDVDFRADQWDDPRAFGVTLRSMLHNVDIVIGTEEELKALALTSSDQLAIRDSQISDPSIAGDLPNAIRMVLSSGPSALVLKEGAEGASVHLPDGRVVRAAPFQVEVVNILGAGDAFAAGFIYGHLQGWPWDKAARMGNANGAIVVTQTGCANFMPTEQETLAFVESQGGF
jgi:5-dehydro-2-deoxygluconokinase